MRATICSPVLALFISTLCLTAAEAAPFRRTRRSHGLHRSDPIDQEQKLDSYSYAYGKKDKEPSCPPGAFWVAAVL